LAQKTEIRAVRFPEDPEPDRVERWRPTTEADTRTGGDLAQVSRGVSDRVTDVDHAVVETSLVQQLEVESNPSR
jgi:hypothetical protein